MAKDKKQDKSTQQKKSGGSKGSESLTEEGAVPAIGDLQMDQGPSLAIDHRSVWDRQNLAWLGARSAGLPA